MLNFGKIGAVFGFAMLLPIVASAQAVISGVVRDASGAVLPGVTVEAASPALIEKVRTTVTDGTGQYAIENLRPGRLHRDVHAAGFATVQREGVELSGTFTARINADLRVGAIEETITVTGETPGGRRGRAPGSSVCWIGKSSMRCRTRASGPVSAC